MTVGEWQVDKDGRRFRYVGEHCKEYEQEITTTFGKYPVGHVPTPEKADRDYTWLDKREDVKTCPFKRRNRCREDCVFRYGNGCGIGHGVVGKSGICPFSGVSCDNGCALYDNGCTLRRE